ncbi:hypothetical protein EVAR_92181_1 [Eumeta japonica]|uniref:DUF4371 domain-containing protein n=1 Tax=Eumeta variegata TaxID=151549 RepID=A0A4C2AAQ8_EUMVA|nr:hypothetical protein EVAR_92181_1 [Eumeta japonica]
MLKVDGIAPDQPCPRVVVRGPWQMRLAARADKAPLFRLEGADRRPRGVSKCVNAESRRLFFYGYDIIDMSGRDRDIGRKWESGSAKRKRKAERTASNQALSLNMMKFLNQTASDALSTESELQLDELGSCSSQSKMDTEILVLSSSNQEEQVLDSPIRSDDAIDQQVLDNLDPGFWKFPITDSQRRDIVQSGPTQQLNDDEYYPKAVTKTTGEYLANAILEHLEKYDLNIQDCRGQGYDNGANMVATEQGLAKYVLPTSNLGLARH